MYRYLSWIMSQMTRTLFYGAVASASLISSSVSAGPNDGVFGDYFRNIINTPCTYGYEVITGFSASSTNYGMRTCTSIFTVLGNIPTTINVGIGTATPAGKLDVAGSIIANYLTIRPQNTTVEGGEILLSHAAGMTKDAYIENASDRFRIHNNTSEILNANLINGNIGIGTATPSAKLDVVGNIRATGLEYGNGLARTESRDNAGLRGDVGAKSGFFETSSPSNYPTGATSWWHLIDSRHSNVTNNYAMQIAGSFFDQNLYFRKTNSSATQGWSKIVAENTAGNVGIGTSTPSAKLEVAGQVKITGGSPGVGKILTSDANGLASWATPTTTAGAGGTVTGPLTWSAEYGAMTYDQAWSTCLFLAPAGQWRIPSTTEIELGRRMNAALFTGFKWFRSSSSSQDWGFWSYSPAYYDGWVSCNRAFMGCSDAWNGYYFPAALRCVSNS